MLLGNDVMLALNGLPVDTEGCQFQWMVQHPRFLGELESCKPGMVGITKTGGEESAPATGRGVGHHSSRTPRENAG